MIMATLKTDFIDGEVLYAGTTSDTDKLNGITNQINLCEKEIIGKNISMATFNITNATEKTSNSSTYALVHTFDLSTSPFGFLINSISLELKKAGGDGSIESYGKVKIYYTDTTSTEEALFTNATSYTSKDYAVDDSKKAYKIEIYLKCDVTNPSYTAYLNNVYIDYAVMVEDTNYELCDGTEITDIDSPLVGNIKPTIQNTYIKIK